MGEPLWDDDEQQNIVVAPGQAALFPEPTQEPTWASADRDPEHRANFDKIVPTCSCGWEGESWVVHYTSVKGKKK